MEAVNEARREEVTFIMKRGGIWELRPVRKSWEKTGKAPMSVR